MSRGSSPHSFSVPIKIFVGGLKICSEINTFLRKTISNLYGVESAPVAHIALPERLESVRDTA